MQKMIIKSSGLKEPFDLKKFERSLKKSGAQEHLIKKIAHEIMQRPDLNTTQQIYYFALQQLEQEYRPLAARYNLKQALLSLGPSGFPFEQFIAHILQAEEYNTNTDVFVTGFCVDHQVDVVAEKNNEHIMVEAKFHNSRGIKTDVKVTLYVQARFEDIKKKLEKVPTQVPVIKTAMVATNTQFTTEAIRYATCINMRLLGWAYPINQSIAELVDRFKLYPITCLTTLNKKQKKELIGKGFVLCKDIHKNINALKALGFKERKLQKIIDEAEGVCSLQV
ncbi:MAG: restriction endonuclease [Candidatus Babeliales bacterium]